MPNVVEIDEEELLRNRKLRDTVQTLLSNPKSKLLIQQATKVVYPNAVTPELDAVTATSEQTNGVAKELNELKSQIAKDKVEREEHDRLRKLHADFEAGFDKLRAQGFTDTGIAEVRKIMEEKGILDHDIAAAYFEKQHPTQDPIRPGVGGWNFMEHVQEDEADLKKLIESKGNNNALVDKMAREALIEVRGQPRR